MIQLAALLRKNLDAKAHDAATSPHNLKPLPTAAQRNAGNYPKGKMRVGGLNISIENPAGSVRNPKWHPMDAHYGYVRGSGAQADGGLLDMFVKPNTPHDWSGNVFVIDQAKPEGGHDEFKCMIGWEDEASARRAYLNHYPHGWEKNIRGIQVMALPEFKVWMKPAAKSLIHGLLRKEFDESQHPRKVEASVNKAFLVERLLKREPKRIKAMPKTALKAKQKALAATLAKYLKAQGKRIAAQIAAHAVKKALLQTILSKALIPAQIIAAIKLEDWDALVNEHMTPEIEAAFKAAGMFAGAQLGVDEPITNLVNDRAVKYAAERSAELVTNIDESTRDMLRATVANAIENGMASRDLAKAIEESRAFSPERADLIASYELGQALEEGNMAMWKESGVVTGKEWLTAEDEIVSDDCQANAAQGVIPLDEEFQSGDMQPLAHPGCRCSAVGVTEPIE